MLLLEGKENFRAESRLFVIVDTPLTPKSESREM